MQRFFLTAQFCTRSGRLGRWTGTVMAPGISAALEMGRQLVERRHRGASKLDIHAMSEQGRFLPDSAGTAGS